MERLTPFLSKRKNIFFVLLILVFVLYGNTLLNDYAIDDELVLLENELVQKGLSGIPEILTSHYDTGMGNGYEYRPILLISFAIEYQFFGVNPFVSHLINLLLFTVLLFLIYIVFKRLFPKKNTKYLLLALLLFLFHPINTEVINNVKSRDELLYFLFSLLTFWYILRYSTHQKKWFFVCAFIFMVIASLTKISAVVFIFLIPFSLYFFKKINLKQSLFWVLTLTIAASSYIFINYLLVQSYDEQIIRKFEFYENPLYYASFLERIPASFGVVAYYIKLLIVPFPLSFYYGFDQVNLLTWGSFLFYALLVVFGLLGYLLFKNRNRVSFLVFICISFLIAIAPYSNLILPAPGIVAERFVFVSSFFFCLILAHLIILLKNKKLIGLIVILILITATPIIWKRNAVWKDALTLMENDIHHLSNSYKANTLYAAKLFNKIDKNWEISELRKIEQHYLKAINVYNQSYTAHNNLSVLYLNFLDEPHKAQDHLSKAIEIDNTKPDAKLNLALAYKLTGNDDAMLELLKQFVIDFPQHLKGRITYIDQLINKELYKQALNLTNEGLEIFFNHPDLLVRKANIYGNLSDLEGSLSTFEELYKVQPTDELLSHIRKLRGFKKN